MNLTAERRALRHAAPVEPLARGHFSRKLSHSYTGMGHPYDGYRLYVEGR